jgi:DNA polymerase III delta prime subunit
MSKFIKSLIPTKLDDLHFNRQLIYRLKNLFTDKSMNNILFFGTYKSGKKTILNAAIKEIYDFNKLKVYSELLKINNNSINVTYLCSSNHFVINPSKYNLYDKYIITNLIKIISKTKNFDDNNKIIVIDEAHLLSMEAQQSLRRTMEIYSKNCKFILVARKLNKVIKPIQSRCLKIRCPLPNEDDIIKRLNDLNQEFNLKLSDSEKEKIVKLSNCNFETLYLIIDMLYNLKIPIEEIKIPENKINNLVELIFNSKTLKDFMKFKDLLTKIIVDNIKLNELIRNILLLVLDKDLSDQQKYLCIQEGAISDRNINFSSKDIFHIEYYIIKIYQIINDQTLFDMSSK